MELSKLMVFLVEANAIAFRVPYFYLYSNSASQSTTSALKQRLNLGAGH